jgi:hypothetical protein
MSRTWYPLTDLQRNPAMLLAQTWPLAFLSGFTVEQEVLFAFRRAWNCFGSLEFRNFFCDGTTPETHRFPMRRCIDQFAEKVRFPSKLASSYGGLLPRATQISKHPSIVRATNNDGRRAKWVIRVGRSVRQLLPMFTR